MLKKKLKKLSINWLVVKKKKELSTIEKSSCLMHNAMNTVLSTKMKRLLTTAYVELLWEFASKQLHKELAKVSGQMFILFE